MDLPRIALGLGLTVALVAISTAGCRKESTLDDIPPAPGDPYSNAKTPPNEVPDRPEPQPDAPSDGASSGDPVSDTRPAPQPEAQPQPKPAPQPAPQPQPEPQTQPAAATPPAAAPAVAMPEQREPDEAGNQQKVKSFERCRAECDSRTDLSAEDKPTCKLACVNGTAPQDTFTDNCKRDCLRDANRCYSPCEASGRASCRQGCAKPLTSCMNDCDVAEPGG